MKKRLVVFLLVATMLLATTAQAALQADYVEPSLTFDGSTAICEIKVVGENTSDEIEVTLTLWRGNFMMDSWSAEGTGYLRMSESVVVTSGYTYRLEADVTINGDALDTLPVSKKCD